MRREQPKPARFPVRQFVGALLFLVPATFLVASIGRPGLDLLQTAQEALPFVVFVALMLVGILMFTGD